MNLILIITVAILAFGAVAGLGFVFAGSGDNTRMSKRAQAITAAPQRERGRVRNPVVDAGARRKQLLKSLKDHERVQRKASVTLTARLQ
jgi:tight adherence protein B